jgi:hypothetical protein
MASCIAINSFIFEVICYVRVVPDALIASRLQGFIVARWYRRILLTEVLFLAAEQSVDVNLCG